MPLGGGLVVDADSHSDQALAIDRPRADRCETDTALARFFGDASGEFRIDGRGGKKIKCFGCRSAIAPVEADNGETSGRQGQHQRGTRAEDSSGKRQLALLLR